MDVSITNGKMENKLFMELDDIKVGNLPPKVRIEYTRLKMMEFFYNKITNKVEEDATKQKMYKCVHDIIYSIDDILIYDLSKESIAIIVHYIYYECGIRGIRFNQNDLANILNAIQFLMS